MRKQVCLATGLAKCLAKGQAEVSILNKSGPHAILHMREQVRLAKGLAKCLAEGEAEGEAEGSNLNESEQKNRSSRS